MGVPGSGAESEDGCSPDGQTDADFPPGGGGSKFRPPKPVGRGLVFPVTPSFFFIFCKERGKRGWYEV